MTDVIMQNLFSFFILFSLLHVIRTDWDNVSEENKIASKPRLENNFNEIENETVTTTAMDKENFDDNDLKKLVTRNFKTYEKLKYTNTTLIEELEKRAYRKSRDIVNGTSNYAIECLSCYANSTSKSDINCYEGMNVALKKCGDAEHCFIELNPQYIKRGCVLPGRVNRTFICKCPLCNDKPSFDISHYEYKKINDWEYDNARLQTPLGGMDLMCKFCETKGTNPTSDKNCRYGKSADYIICTHNQLCYTNIDDEADFVSRGCIDRPLLNSIYFFCNDTECNTNKFPSPKENIRLRAEAIKLKDEPRRRKRVKSSLGSNICTIDFYLVFLNILTLLCI